MQIKAWLTLLAVATTFAFAPIVRAAESEPQPEKKSEAPKPEVENDQAASLNEQGMKALKEKRYKEAQELFEKSMQLLSGQPDQVFSVAQVQLNLSVALRELGKTKEADDYKAQSEQIMVNLLGAELMKNGPPRPVGAIGQNATVRSMMQQIMAGLKDVAAGKSNTINVTMPPDTVNKSPAGEPGK
jgi:tetratricopeptide (TPR) repeat protein